jgi:hypothetical protein
LSYSIDLRNLTLSNRNTALETNISDFSLYEEIVPFKKKNYSVLFAVVLISNFQLFFDEMRFNAIFHAYAKK